MRLVKKVLFFSISLAFIVAIFVFVGDKNILAATIIVDNGTSTVAEDGSCSLREAIENANDDAATNVDCVAGSGADIIDIQTDITLTAADHQEGLVNFATPTVTETITINGNGYTISRSGATEMQFMILNGADVSLYIDNVTISNFSRNAGSGYSGAIVLTDAGTGILDINNVTFSGNQNGVIFCEAGGGFGDWSITNSTFSSNVSADAGIIDTIPRNLTISGSTFTSNTNSGGVDGAVVSLVNISEVDEFDLNISDSTFTSNDASNGFGGVIGISTYFLSSVNLNISDSTFTSNTASNGGGVISAEGGSGNEITVNISDSTFTSNTSDTVGGVIYSQDEVSIDISDSDFVSNSSEDSGGVIHLEKNTSTPSLDISGSYFTENITSGTGSGGILYADTDSSSTVSNSYFYYNRPSTLNGGVFFLETGSDLTVSNSTFDNNVAGNGGVFYLDDGADLTVYNSSFDNSTAIDNGGLIYSYQDEAGTINEIDFYHNTEETSFAGENGGTTFYNCIDTAEGCYGNGEDPWGDTPFVGTYFVFENNILHGGCDGNTQNTSFTNNLVFTNGGERCSDDGSDVDVVTNLNTTLGDNGGLWKTFLISTGSNALDAGVSGTLGCPATDARGFPRPYNSVCDIGAYEYAGPAAVTITETGGSTDVSEDGTTDTYTIVLGGNPSSDVVVDLSFYNSPDVVFPTDSFTFTTLNWFTPQTVNVSAVDDSDVEGEENLPVSHIITTSDVDYGALNPDLVYVNITDNDTSSTSGGSGSTTSNTSTETTPPPPLPVYGCTNPLATNYNPSADSNDGSCILPIPIIVGCTDDVATNYNPSANEDDGSCQYQVVVIYGCTDNLAINHNPSANEDDGSCVYEQEEVIEDTEEVIGDESGDNDGQTESNNSNDPAGNEASRDIGSFGVTSLDLDKVISVATDVVSEKTATSVSAAGLALPVVAFIVTQPAAAASIPIRFWNLIPTLIGLRRKRRPWGTVYDSVTKQPLDPVHVVLEDLEGKQIATTITDLDGRFGFLVQPGKYRIKVYKDNYQFPSRKLSGQDKDELYSDLYFNEEVEVVDEETIIVKNIPMDSTSFNWNEFEKSKNKKLMKFYSKRDLFLARISDFTFYAGIVFSLIMMFKAPAPLNYIIFGVYVVVITLRLFGVKPKKPGYVIDKDTGEPLSFGIMRVFSKALNREVAHSVISETGKYYSLVPNGEYFVKIQKKTGEDSYEDISTTDPFKVTGGYIGKVLKV